MNLELEEIKQDIKTLYDFFTFWKDYVPDFFANKHDLESDVENANKIIEKFEEKCQ